VLDDARFTLRELAKTRSAIFDAWTSGRLEGVRELDLNERENIVTVGVSRSTDTVFTRSLLDALGVANEQVSMRVVGELSLTRAISSLAGC
jgi:hypothetical protein